MVVYHGVNAVAHAFPNIVPLIENTLALGFEIASDSFGKTVMKKSFGTHDFFITMYAETACWDTSDGTHLCFSVNEPAQQLGAYGPGVHCGTRDVASSEVIEARIVDYLDGVRHRAEEKLRTAYAEYDAVRDFRWA